MKNKSKIIITSPFIETGGVSQFVKNLSPYFGNNVKQFRRGKRKASSIFSFIFLPFDIVRFFIYIIFSKPDKIIINSSLANIGIIRDGFYVLLSKILGVKTLLFIHGFDKKALKKKKLIHLGYFQADKIFVLAKEFKKLLEGIGYSKLIIVSNNPVDNTLLDKQVEREVKQSSDQLNLLMMSRIEKSKGIFLGLELMMNLKSKNIVLNIAGTGSELENAKNYVRINDLKNVIFHGFITGSKKNELLKKSDILLFPTFHNEGLPINILEGLVMGLFVITRPVAGIIDLSEKYFMNIVSSNEVDDFMAVIDKVLNEGLPIKKINKNQSSAIVDFSAFEVYNKILSYLNKC